MFEKRKNCLFGEWLWGSLGWFGTLERPEPLGNWGVGAVRNSSLIDITLKA